MGTGYHGGFGGTLGSTYEGDTRNASEESYSDRGIEIPENVRTLLEKLSHKGDYVTGKNTDYSMTDVSIMSKESKVEFAKVIIGDEAYLIRGDSKGAVIPAHILSAIEKKSGRLVFHSHPRNDDLIPSMRDREVLGRLKKLTGQQYSTIVTPNGRLSTFNEHGVIETGHIANTLDDSHKKALLELFGGK